MRTKKDQIQVYEEQQTLGGIILKSARFVAQAVCKGKVVEIDGLYGGTASLERVRNDSQRSRISVKWEKRTQLYHMSTLNVEVYSIVRIHCFVSLLTP